MNPQSPDESKVLAQFTFLMTEHEIRDRAIRLGLPPPTLEICEKIGRKLIAAWMYSDLAEKLYEISDQVIRDGAGL